MQSFQTEWKRPALALLPATFPQIHPVPPHMPADYMKQTGEHVLESTRGRADGRRMSLECNSKTKDEFNKDQNLN